ncbi:hypothetical protein ACFPN1_16095 [Lysobacter yangpyeongensis]|uniref:Zinc ribbon domain-containing protein n=1 Tax=Lysobacter yangpyeongensis TaxID=346182 RepID=A0ABW0SR23_9GAMM
MLAALKVLITIALLGLLCSAAMHVAVLFGASPPSEFARTLQLGLILIFLPVAIITWKIRYTDGDWLQWEWTAVYRGSPWWLNGLCILLIVYIFFSTSSLQPLRYASALLMSLYCMGLSVFVSAYRQHWLLMGLRCPNGHCVSHVNRFCPECGACLPKSPAGA